MTTIHVSPIKVVLNPRFIPPNWYYYFEHIALKLKEGKEYSYSFGGKAFFKLWVIKKDTQLWFDVHDEFGNVLAFYSGPDSSRYIRLRIFEDGSKVYDDNIGKYIPGTLFYAIGRTFSDNASFLLEIDLGPLGGLGKFTVEDTLYSEENLCKFRDIRTENFNLHIPLEHFWTISGQRRDEIFIDNLEAIYTFIGDFTGEVLEGKPHKCEVNFGWCGVAGRNFVGYDVGVARWPVHANPSLLGVLSHELGHMYSFTPPLTYGVECPWFCEPLATYLGIEGIARMYGENVRLWYWGSHPRFFDYLSGKDEFDAIENMQFIFFYIHRTYGPDTHKQFFKVWNSGLRDKLLSNRFNKIEAVCVLYSYLVNENLAWIFKLAGFDISEEKINYGMSIIPLSSTITCNVNPNSIPIGDSIVISGRINPPHVANVTLTLVSPTGKMFSEVVSSDDFGFYQLIFKPDEIGNWTVNASWLGDLDHEGAVSEKLFFKVGYGLPKLVINEPHIDGLTVSINGKAIPWSSDVSIVRLQWDWGDGTVEERWFPAIHTYAKPGTYTITITAYQSDRQSITKTVVVVLIEESTTLLITPLMLTPTPTQTFQTPGFCIVTAFLGLSIVFLILRDR